MDLVKSSGPPAGRRFSTPVVCLIALAVFVPFVTATAVTAQIDTGGLVIRAVDPDGEPLVGAEVELSGPQSRMRKTTGRDGVARLPALIPGSYAATVRSEGFRTVVGEDILISTGRDVVVEIRLEVAGVEESLVVTGKSSMLDLRSADVGTVYSEQMIDNTPTASGLPGGVLDHVPGVVQIVDQNYEVGGILATGRHRISTRGAAADQNSWVLDGSAVDDPRALESAMRYSVSAFEEVQVSTAAHDVEFHKPGVAINMVTKSGGNEFHGGGRFQIASEGLQADNFDQELEARNASEQSGIHRLQDYDVQLGGPILRDRAWFFADFWRYRIDRLAGGLPEGVFDTEELTNWTVRGAWRPLDDLRLSGTYRSSRNVIPHAGAGEFVPIGSTVDIDEFTDVPQLQAEYVVGEEGYLDVRFSKLDSDLLSVSRPDAPAGRPIVDFFDGTISGPPFGEDNLQRDRSQLGANYTQFMQGEDSSHDLKLGFRYARLQGVEPGTFTGGVLQFDFDGDPFLVQIFNTPALDDIRSIEPPEAPTERITETAVYAQDTWSTARVTLTGAIRFDASTGSIPTQRRPESFFPELGPEFRAAEFPAREDVTEWREVQPRLSGVIDVFDDGRWALKGSFARYVNSQTLDFPALENRNRPGSELWFWSDLDGDGIFDTGEQTFLLGRDFPGANQFIADDFKAPVTQEVTLGVQHQPSDDWLLSATYVNREAHDLTALENAGVPFDPETGAPSYEVVSVRDPGPDGVLGTADDGGAIQVFNQVENFGEDLRIAFNPEQRGFRFPQVYRGLDLVVEKRWSDNWQLLASWTIQKAEGLLNGVNPMVDQSFIARDVFANPNRILNAEGELHSSRRHVIKVTGSYFFAEPIGVNIGAFFRHMSGFPWGRSIITRLDQGGQRIMVERRGARTSPAIRMLDLRAEKRFELPDRWGSIDGYVDVFNVFNANTPTNINTISGPRFRRVFSYLNPRLLRIGAAWSF